MKNPETPTVDLSPAARTAVDTLLRLADHGLASALEDPRQLGRWLPIVAEALHQLQDLLHNAAQLDKLPKVG